MGLAPQVNGSNLDKWTCGEQFKAQYKQWAHNNNTFFFWVKYNKMHCWFKNYKHRLERNMKDFKRNSSTDLKGKPQKLKRDNIVGSAMDDGASGRRLWRRKTIRRRRSGSCLSWGLHRRWLTSLVTVVRGKDRVDSDDWWVCSWWLLDCGVCGLFCVSQLVADGLRGFFFFFFLLGLCVWVLWSKAGTDGGHRLGRHHWLLCWLGDEKLMWGCGVYMDCQGWFGLVQDLMRQKLER